MEEARLDSDVKKPLATKSHEEPKKMTEHHARPGPKHCEICNIYITKNKDFPAHIKTKKHQINELKIKGEYIEEPKEEKPKYKFCDACNKNIACRDNHHWARHLKTKLHMANDLKNHPEEINNAVNLLGCVKFDKSNNAYKFEIRRGETRARKSFKITKTRTEEEAKRLAEEYQKNYTLGLL